jgi:hypothetical protein
MTSAVSIPLCLPALTTLVVFFAQHFDFFGIEQLVHLNKLELYQRSGVVDGSVSFANSCVLTSCRALSSLTLELFSNATLNDASLLKAVWELVVCGQLLELFILCD